MGTLKQISLLCLFILLMMTSGCKKYPDGPLLSLQTKQQRMTGRWVVSNFTVDGYDSTAHLQSQPYYGVYYIGAKYDGLNPWGIENPNSSSVRGYWEFVNNRNDIQFNARWGNGTNCPYANSITEWEIRKLTKEELWLKTSYNGKSYIMKMIKTFEL